MEIFEGKGFNPRRTIPRMMCSVYASGCSAVNRTSVSFILRTWRKSFLEAFEEDVRFIAARLSE